MRNVSMMYLRPGNLYKDFIIEKSGQDVNSRGRPIIGHGGDGNDILRGCLADASADDKASHSSSDHTVTHTISQAGAPRARREERLIFGERVFYVCDVDDCGSLGLATLYYVEERDDIR